MISRERVAAALRREVPDRVPWCELFIDPILASKLLNWSGPANQTNSLEVQQYTVDESRRVADFLQMDNIAYIFRAPIYADRHYGDDGRMFYGEGQIKTRADLDKLVVPKVTRESLAPLEAFAQGKGDYSAWLVTRVGIMPTMLSMGTTAFSYALYDDLGLVETIFDRYLEWTLEVARRAAGLGFDVFASTDDVAFGTTTFFSPRFFRELCLPRFQDVKAELGIPWLIHSDGNMLPFMDMLTSLEFAAFHPMEKGAMDIRQMKELYGDKLCLMGNLDLNILGMGTPDEVEAEARFLLSEIAPGGGYIISSGNSLASYLIPENVIAMRDTIQKYAAYS